MASRLNDAHPQIEWTTDELGWGAAGVWGWVGLTIGSQLECGGMTGIRHG